MKKRVLSILLAATMVGTMIAGCGNSGGNSEGGSSDSGDGEGSSITVLVESGSPAEALANETAADFEAETGCKVVVDAVAYTGMYDKLSTEIQSGQAAHDVACMDFVWLAAFADAIEPLQDADTSDFLPTLEESGTIDGNLLGYPMWTNCKILIYRKDLIPEDQVPTTWMSIRQWRKRRPQETYMEQLCLEAARMQCALSWILLVRPEQRGLCLTKKVM